MAGVTRRRLLTGVLAVGGAAMLDGGGAASAEGAEFPVAGGASAGGAEFPVAGGASAGGAEVPANGTAGRPLEEFPYEQVRVSGAVQVAQRENVRGVLMGFDEDSLLRPFREMTGRPGPGVNLGGWYCWKADYDHHHGDAGFAPGSTFGQWTSAMARMAAGSRFGGGAGDVAMAAKVNRLHAGLGETMAPSYFEQTRFPSYTLDKLVCGLMDGHRLLGDAGAFPTLDRVTTAAEPSLPGHAMERDIQWRMGKDISWMWDEHYTLPENFYLVSAMGAGERYRRLAEKYLLDETYFEPLSRGVNALGDKHAYSHVNALCSAMQAYLVGGSKMHLRAARNGFGMLEEQSFATGGWGPDELLRAPGYDQVAKSLTASHNGFEAPCGSYAHTKLTRYLLRVTRDGRYGDSMERVMLNTVMGALPLQADGRTFYSQDYNVMGKRVYSEHRWPCCSGTLPQVVADYGVNGYLREPGAVWVVLYQPSEVRWMEGATAVGMEQTGEYVQDGRVKLRVTAARPVRFAVRLRVPGWAGDGMTVLVNGRSLAARVDAGFATVDRVWRTGDVVEVALPMALRLQALPPDGAVSHEDTVALMRGPAVLFPLREAGETGPIAMKREAVLGAERTGAMEWTATDAAGSRRRMVPFVDVGERVYSTYVKLV